MKQIKITKTITILNKEGEIIKEVDVSTLPWYLALPRAVQTLTSSLYGHRWQIIVTPIVETKDE